MIDLYSAATPNGHKASIEPNELSESGVPTHIDLGRSVSLSHAVGGIPLPEGWTEVTDIAIGDGKLVITGDTGDSVEIPYDPGFIGLR